MRLRPHLLLLRNSAAAAIGLSRGESAAETGTNARGGDDLPDQRQIGGEHQPLASLQYRGTHLLNPELTARVMFPVLLVRLPCDEYRAELEMAQ